MAHIIIANQTLESVQWSDMASCQYSIDGGVDIWRINIGDNLKVIENLHSVLSADEITRANRFFYSKDKNRHIVGHGAIRIILGRYLNQSPSSIEFEYEANKKPFIVNKMGLHFNLSHSGDWVLLAIANSPIGVDVELINPGFEYKDVMEGYFSPVEVNYINKGNSAERFYLLWTRKEAQIKGTGKGLDENIKLIPGLAGTHNIDQDVISSDDDWLINSFNLDEQHVASVATNPLTREIRFWDVDFH
ncbi:MAG TPA: 4'-phosphopantetheinyl transferase superfamily protein [Mucilaginibacter sp.]|jgi:4'-phosphopantetheinyl transferase